MKKILLIVSILAAIFSCNKKETVTPSTTNTVIQHDTVKTTVTVIKHDTVYCIPKSDIIQGTWYYYAYKASGSSTTTTVTPSQPMIFTSTTYNMNGSTGNAAISSDYSSIYINQTTTTGTPFFTVFVNNCDELRLVTSNGSTTYLRRTQ
jgi:hypothetical protein